MEAILFTICSYSSLLFLIVVVVVEEEPINNDFNGRSIPCVSCTYN